MTDVVSGNVANVSGNEKPPDSGDCAEVDGWTRTPGAGVRYRMTKKLGRRCSGGRAPMNQSFCHLPRRSVNRFPARRAENRLCEIQSAFCGLRTLSTALSSVEGLLASGSGWYSALVVVVGLAFAGWYFFLKSDPEPRAAIEKTPVVTDEHRVGPRRRQRARAGSTAPIPSSRGAPTTSWATASPRSSSPTWPRAPRPGAPTTSPAP